VGILESQFPWLTFNTLWFSITNRRGECKRTRRKRERRMWFWTIKAWFWCRKQMLKGEQEGKRIQVRQEEKQGRYSSERAPEKEVNEGQVPEEDPPHIE